MTRKPRDLYPTPRGLTRQIVTYIAPPHADRILDPGCGFGVFGEECRRKYPGATIHGVDLHPMVGDGYDVIAIGNFLSASTMRDMAIEEAYHEAGAINGIVDIDPDDRPYDLIIGNPPFNLAEAFIRTAYDHLAPDGWLVFLLRLGFAESQDRIAFWREYPAAQVWPLAERPSFTGNGATDGQAYAVFVWRGALGYPGHAKWMPGLLWKAVDQELEVGRYQGPLPGLAVSHD